MSFDGPMLDYCSVCGFYYVLGDSCQCEQAAVDTQDQVNSPEHYTQGGVETIEILEAKLSEEEFTGYCKGNVIKYLTRALHKGRCKEDLEKAQWYLNRLVSYVSNTSVK